MAGCTPSPTSSRHDHGVAVVRAPAPGAEPVGVDREIRGAPPRCRGCRRATVPVRRAERAASPGRPRPSSSRPAGGPVAGDPGRHVVVGDRRPVATYVTGAGSRPRAARPPPTSPTGRRRAPRVITLACAALPSTACVDGPGQPGAPRDAGPPKACGGPDPRPGQAMHTASVAVPVPAMPVRQGLGLGLGGGGHRVDQGGVGQPLGHAATTRLIVPTRLTGRRTLGRRGPRRVPQPDGGDTSTPASVPSCTSADVGGGQHADPPARQARATRRACRRWWSGSRRPYDCGTWAFTTQRRTPDAPAVGGRRHHAHGRGERATPSTGVARPASCRDRTCMSMCTSSRSARRSPGRQVSWLPDRRSPRPSRPLGPWPLRGVRSPVTVAGQPRTSHRVPCAASRIIRDSPLRSAPMARAESIVLVNTGSRQGQVVGRVRGHGPGLGPGLAGRRRAVHQGRQVEDRRAQAGRPPRHRVAHPGRRLHLGVHRPRRDGRQGPPRLGGRRAPSWRRATTTCSSSTSSPTR